METQKNLDTPGITSSVECKREWDTIFALQDGEVIWKLHFSLGINNQGVRFGKIDFIITSNYLHSQFESPKEIQGLYSKYLNNLVIHWERIPWIAQRLIEELIQYLKGNGYTHIYLEPDTSSKQVYWKEKIGKKLKDLWKIFRYYWREEICFEL